MKKVDIWHMDLIRRFEAFLFMLVILPLLYGEIKAKSSKCLVLPQVNQVMEKTLNMHHECKCITWVINTLSK